MQEEKKFCECGCGEEVNPGRRFVHGHHHRCRSEETRKKFSEVRKGKKPSAETLKKLREARKLMVGEKAPHYGKKHSEETKRKYSEDRRGKPNSCGPKISERNLEMWKDPEMREKWSASKRGENHPLWGKQHLAETRMKMSLSRGGDGEIDLERQIKRLSFYVQWRESVLDKFGRQCEICGEKDYVIVHHIERVSEILERKSVSGIDDALKCKELWEEDNVILLCPSHHTKWHKNKKFRERVSKRFGIT